MPDEQEVVKPETQVTAPEPEAETTAAPVEATTDTPDQSTPPATGSDEAAEAEATPPADAGSEQTRQPPKPHGQRASATIRGLKSENKELKAKLASLTGAKPAIGGVPNAPAKPEETPEYWAAECKKAYDAGDTQQHAIAYQRYEAAKESALERRLLERINGEAQRQQASAVLNDKLLRLHERSPIFKENDKGTLEIDINSPVIQRAAQLADEAQTAIATPQGIRWDAFLYFVTDAVLDLQGQTVQQTTAALDHQKVQTVKANSRTALESTSQPGLAKPSGPRVELEKQVKALEAKAAKGYNAEVNSQLMLARIKLRNLSARPAQT